MAAKASLTPDEVITFYITLIASLPILALLCASLGEEFLKI